LCMLIVGGMGSVLGVLLGAVIMVGFNSIVLVKISDMLARMGFVGTGNVFLSPNNWKYLIFGLALVLMMRFRPEGFLPSKRMRAELHDLEEQDE
ncbi:MAG: branched-chain amino acid ABC transporter permease, partial [Proteobacteria bacterium]